MVHAVTYLPLIRSGQPPTDGVFSVQRSRRQVTSVQPVAQESSSEFNPEFPPDPPPAKTRPSWQGTANDKTKQSHSSAGSRCSRREGKNSQMQVVPFGEFLHKKFNQSRIGNGNGKRKRKKKKIGRRAIKLAGAASVMH